MTEQNGTVPYSVLAQSNWIVSSLWEGLKNQPDGVTLNDIVDFNVRKLSIEKDIDPNRTYIYLEVGDVQASTGIIKIPEPTTGQNLTERAKNIARPGDILLSLVRPQNRNIAIVPPNIETCIVSNIFAVLTPKNLSSELLFFVLRSDIVTGILTGKITGAIIPSINLKQLKTTRIPFREYPVGSDKYLQAKRLYEEWIDRTGNENGWDKIITEVFSSTILESYKEISSDTQQGFFLLLYNNLGERWDVSYHNTLRLEPEVSWKCPVYKLEDIVTFPRVVADVQDDSGENAKPFIRTRDIQENDVWIDSNDVIKVSTTPRGDDKLRSGDILMVKTGAASGKVAIVPEDLAGGAINQHVIAIRTKPELDSEFLLLYLRSSWSRYQIDKLTANVTQPFIQLSDFGKITIPVPDLKTQHEIVSSVKKTREKNDLKELVSKIELFLGELLIAEKG